MRVRVFCPNLTVLARSEPRRTQLAEFGFSVEMKTDGGGAEYLSCVDDLEKDVRIAELIEICKATGN